jgi:methionyl-tRNA formyltransferase
VVFLGTPAPAVPSLEALLAAGHDVPLVVTQPDRPRARSSARVAPAVKEAALAHGIAVHQPTRVRDAAFRDTIARAAPELLVVVAYGRILPAAVLDTPTDGAVNVHFSLLPLYRGAAPVQWALARGEKTTGVTTMRIRPELDAGEILLQKEVGIRSGEHAPALQTRLAGHGAELLVETLAAMRSGTLRPRARRRV